MTASFTALTVPIDASPGSRHSVDYAVTIAQRGAKLHFCSVVEAGVAAAYSGGAMAAAMDPFPFEAREQSASRICSEALATADRHGVTADANVLFGAAAPAIGRFARETGSDAIVLCTQARAGLACVIAGSVTEGVLASSELPVIVTHADDDHRLAGLITVAIDGSAASAAALQTAIAIAHAGDRPMSIVHVVEPGGEWSEAAAMLNVAGTCARESQIDYELVTLRGNAASTIVESARQRHSPMIVIGTHGRSAPAPVVLGSVARAVVAYATVPVTVVSH